MLIHKKLCSNFKWDSVIGPPEPGLVSLWTGNQVSKKKHYCLTCVIVRHNTDACDYIQSHLGVGFVSGVHVCVSVINFLMFFLK